MRAPHLHLHADGGSLGRPSPPRRSPRLASLPVARRSLGPRLLVILLVLLALLLAFPAESQHRFVLQLSGGGAWNARTPVTLEQEGEPDLDFSASFETRPFEQPLYWALKASLQDRKGAWELQLLHHKLYLTDPPPQVQHLEVTHGFNLVTFGRSFPLGSGFAARAAAGVVVAHTESVVRGSYEGGSGTFSGYELAGPAFFGGAGWQRPLGRHFLLSAEAAVSAARARVSVARGHATFWNVAAHALVGLGFRFGGPLP